MHVAAEKGDLETFLKSAPALPTSGTAAPRLNKKMAGGARGRGSASSRS